MNQIQFRDDVCGAPERASSLEWLETNGLGGFASSSIIGLNTRRYHGLLTAATKPPVGRLLLLSKLEETVTIGGRKYEFSANQYPGVVHPQGYRFLKSFRLDPFPVFTYQVDGVEIEKRVFMVHGENTTVIEYEIRSPSTECVLELRPLIAFRDYHGTAHRNDALNPAVESWEGAVKLKPYPDLPALFLSHSPAEREATGDWYLNFEYAIERERGLDFQEDLFNPCVLRFRMDRPAAVIASLEPHDAAMAPALRQQEISRRAAVVRRSPSDQPMVQALAAAADQFIVRRGEFSTIVAGYPWFTDWGRDTMIALPGLTLTTGRPEIARQILQAFAESADRGMLPNRFPDAGEAPEYNTVDATLWFFEAIRSYLHSTGDYGFVRQHLYAKLQEIIEWHVRGTRYGIRAADDGLLNCGEPGVQLTWMDAKIGDWVVTPRSGKPVEIQALWYNALRIMEELERRFGNADQAAVLANQATRARESFNAQFWNDAAGCLYDVVDGDQRDGAVRPNQIFAVSLPHSMLPPDRAKQVVDAVRRELLTPLGLRSLSPQDSRYRPRYQGGVWDRDSAYHQGTVWPWLLGPFLTAYVKVNGGSRQARRQAAEWLVALEPHLTEAGLGQISEVADADAPHRPGGCMAQAWSVAELLRAAVEDVYQIQVARSPRTTARKNERKRQATA